MCRTGRTSTRPSVASGIRAATSIAPFGAVALDEEDAGQVRFCLRERPVGGHCLALALSAGTIDYDDTGPSRR